MPKEPGDARFGSRAGRYRLGDFAIAAGLALATWAVYSQTLGFDFVGADDHRYITENVTVQGGLSVANTVWAFTTLSESNWHPLTWMSHLLDIEIYGVDDPGGHHLSGVLLHVLNTLLLFGLLQYLTGSRWRSGLVAALFALHPLHVESVAWVSERKDVLSTLFWLVSIGLYAAWTREGQPRRRSIYLALSVTAMALGLLAKPMLVTLPFVLLLLDYWPLERTGTRRPLELLREKTPFFILAAISCLLTLSAQATGGAMRSSESVSLGLRMANAAVSYVGYLGKAIWPTDLAILYPHPNIPGAGGTPWSGWEIAAAFAVLVSLTALVFFGHRKRYLVVGWLGFLGTLVPVIGVVQVGTQAMADRYTYVPLIWVFVALSWGAGDLVGALRGRLPAARALVAGLAVAWIAALAVLAWEQTRVWRNSLTLFEHGLAISPNSSILHLAYATALAEQGRLRESIGHGKRALEIRPDFPEAHSDLGSHLSDLGRHKPALKHHRRAVALRPRAAEAHYNYAAALARSGDPETARKEYQLALRYNPGFAPAHHNLASLLRADGEFEAAIEHYRAALAANPYLAGTHYHLGLTLAAQGQPEEAAHHFRSSLELNPRDQRAQEQLEILAGSALPPPGSATGPESP